MAVKAKYLYCSFFQKKGIYQQISNNFVTGVIAVNVNNKFHAMFFTCIAAILAASLYSVKYLSGQFIFACIALAILSSALMALSVCFTEKTLRPINIFIKKISAFFNQQDRGSLKVFSYRIEEICSSIKIVDSLPIGIMVVDRDGAIRFFNREAGEITEHVPSTVIGKPMINFFPNNYYNYTMEVIKTGREYLGLRNIIRVQDFFKELLFNISPLYNQDVIAGAVATFQDVTPQQKMIEVKAAYSLARDLASQRDLNSTVQVVVKAAAEMAETEFSAVLLADEKGNLTIRSSHGIPPEAVEKYNASPCHVNSPEVAELYRNKLPVLHGDLLARTNIKALLIMPDIRSFYSFPILYEGQLVGLLNLYSRERNKLSKDMINLIRSLYGQVNTAITNFYEFQRMRTMASTDGLTGLLNKSFFLETARTEISRAAAANIPLSLAMLDIDHFKLVNDNYGHQTGDEVLKSIARLISESFREIDHVCRYGGEEFSAIMPGTPKNKALEAVERIRAKIEGAAFTCEDGKQLNITISGGVACFPEDAANLDDLILYSDTALYTAKRSGRNMVVGYTREQKMSE
jgi:diguanylate cyclase (GGDEF)-like protein/PAS domain S-box-containing protein